MPRLNRRSARLVIVDDECRVLLIGVTDPVSGIEVWVTPGGGVEDGEEIAAAAVRELLEETGLERTPAELGAVVAMAQGDFEFGGRLISTVDHYFFIRSPNFDLDDTGWTELEREVHSGWRWWTCEELDSPQENVFPAGLANLARDLFARGRASSADPVELPWTRI